MPSCKWFLVYLKPSSASQAEDKFSHQDLQTKKPCFSLFFFLGLSAIDGDDASKSAVAPHYDLSDMILKVRLIVKSCKVIYQRTRSHQESSLGLVGNRSHCYLERHSVWNGEQEQGTQPRLTQEWLDKIHDVKSIFENKSIFKLFFCFKKSF